VARFEVPEGWTVQAFRFTLDPTDDQARALAKHFGARRKAYNWTVATLIADIETWQGTGVDTAKPSLQVLRKRWNTIKSDVCVNAETGAVWWPECSKEAYADGIRGAVDAYWNWQNSRSGKRAGKRFKRKGRDADRVCFTTGAMRVEPDRRHLTLPVIGTVRAYENTAVSNASSGLVGRVCWRFRCAAMAPGWMRVCACLSDALNNLTSRYLIRGWVSMSESVVWPWSPPLTAR
jgi:putative transposase